MVQICAYWQAHIKNILSIHTNLDMQEAGTKVGPDQPLGPPVRVGSTRIDSDRLGS